MDNDFNIVENSTLNLLVEPKPSDLEILMAISRTRPEYKDFVSDVLMGEDFSEEEWLLLVGSADTELLANVGVMCFAIRYTIRMGGSVAFDLSKIVDLGEYKPRFDEIVKKINKKVNNDDVPTSKELLEWFQQ
tara:strand:- start:464 stop:862 length:399 start_codon:yes stop_codon:yes gene_type:complete